ncbi:MAG TPA: ParB/Srx family N-terminal domain-containing protein [Terracidiphilus sp.]|nr:ParB/Srx family N-terminal domain-containing protein [Terracidiphilus sp.]
MTALPEMLSPLTVKIEQLLLDPNNPRFSELGEDLNNVSEGRFADEKVQAFTFDKMRADVFDVSELKDTIKTLGFLPMDRMVVRRWRGNPTGTDDKYVVIEGNRRLTALRWLISLHEIGKENFSAEQLNNFTNLECLLLDDEAAPSTASLILPGLRHVSGIKEWGPYQKAKAVYALRKSGLSSQDAAQSLGLSTRAANSAYKCYLALEQMKNDEEYGEHAVPRMYSYFEEVFKRPNVRTWLSWSDDDEGFTEEERVKEFYSWIIPGDDGQSPKLPEAKSVRELSEILSDDSAMNILRSPEGSLSRAVLRFEVDHPEDWYPKVAAAASAVNSLTPDKLRSLDQSTLSSLVELKDKITQALKDRESLIGQQS